MLFPGPRRSTGSTVSSPVVLFDWIERTTWISNLAEDPATRSNTSVCLSLADAAIAALSPEAEARFVKAMVVLLDREDVAKDIGSYRDAPPGLRIWTGATVEAADLEALTPWLDWAFAETKRSFSP